MKTLVERPQYFFIPRWQFKQLSKNVILKDRILYKELRSALSIIDLAELVALNGQIEFKNTDLDFSGNMRDFITQPTEVEEVEFDNTIMPMSQMTTTISNIIARLSNEPVLDTGIKPYTVITMTTSVIIVVDDTFLNYLSVSDKNSLTFIEDVLKALYKISSIFFVANTAIFKKYLDLL